MAAPTPPSADPTDTRMDDLSKSLKLLLEQNNLREKGLEGVRKERNLMAEMVKLSKEAGVNFHAESENIGSAVDKMNELDKVLSKIRVKENENISLESEYIELLKEGVEESIAYATLQKKLESDLADARYAADDGQLYGEIGKKLFELAKTESKRLTDLKERLTLIAEELEINRELLKALKQKKEQFELLNEMAKSLLPILGKAGNELYTMGTNIVKAYKDAGLLGAAIALVTEFLKIGVERFKELQETAEKFRKDTGLTLSQTSAISQYVKQLNADYQSMGVSLQEAYDSAKELMSELGNSKVLDNNKSLIQTSSLLAANYGVAAQDAAGFQLRHEFLSRVICFLQ